MKKKLQIIFWVGIILTVASVFLVFFMDLIQALYLVHIGMITSTMAAFMPKVRRQEKWKQCAVWLGNSSALVLAIICDYFYIISNLRMATIFGVLTSFVFYGTWIATQWNVQVCEE